MSQVPPQGRQSARRLAFGSGAAAASLGVATSVAAATGATIVAGPFGFAAALAGLYAWAANQFANDPADPDYDHRAVVRILPLSVSHFPVGPVPGELARLSISLNETTGWLRATIRAFERAQGAAEAGDTQIATERLVETRQLARGAARHVEESASRFEATAGTFESPGTDLPWLREAVGLQPLTRDLLGYDVLGFIYVGGLPLKDFERAAEASGRRGDMPTQASPTEVCTASAEASRGFAEFLTEWEPTVERGTQR